MSDPVAAALALPPGRHLIAVAGPPAAGKSTFAVTYAADLTAAGRPAQVVPMDGFHLDNALLDARGLRARKGAPETFDLRGFARLLQDIRGGGEVIHPLFDRARDLSVGSAAVLPADVDLAVVEGNYLLYDAPGWRDLAPLWSLSVFLDVPEPVLEERLVARWLAHGHDAAAAHARAEANDLPNARAIVRHRLPAHILL
ncbi:nucleoside/nucleotide kinase family protein [Rhodobacteraceae bacterium CCMM004]|nr:nucleoside/nucleotide kinase family protein [Rhodobacteraceae bacterium CCMM004]